MYEQSCELIYKIIAERIRFKRDTLGLRNKDVYPGQSGNGNENDNLISAIVHNRRDPKKNKYLIPNDYIDTIADNLQCNPWELLWGDYDEYSAYGGALFYHIINDALSCEDESTCDSIEKILFEYVPYAISDFYFNELTEHGDIIGYILDESMKSTAADCSENREKAIARLYTIYSDLLGDFLFSNSEHPTTRKLDKQFSSFVKDLLLPRASEDIEDYSLGKNARDILEHRIEHLIEAEYIDMTTSGESAYYYHLDERTEFIRETVHSLTEADYKYVLNIAEIQLQYEGEPDMTELFNKWHSGMCI